jgi:hypothetical protein
MYMATAAATIDDDFDEIDESWPRPLLTMAVPSWLVSAVIHTGAVVVLALLTISRPEKPPGTVLEGVVEAADEAELFHPTSFEPSEIKDATLTSSIAVTDLTSASVSDGGQLGGIAASLATSGVEVAAHAEIGELFSGDGSRRMGSSIGSDAGKAAQFFGVKAAGRRFVFIVDSSNSMRGGKFDAAKQELMYSIRRLSPDQAFYIIFFDANAERMLLPPSKEPPLLPVPATTPNINRVEQWMKGVQNELRTLPYDAVKFALDMVPDAIYLLTDGKFTDKGRTEQYLKANNIVDDPVDGKKPKVVIHTICFWQNDGEETLQAIAKAYGGTYRFVPREKK